jgi:hypothetical protein
MPKDTNFEISGNNLWISRSNWRAVTTYSKEKYDSIAGREWRKDAKGYIINSTLGYLHRYVMELWYGKDMLLAMTDRGYVVDHMNNDPTDCRISNLEFLKKSYNTAKGQAFDVDSKEMKWNIAVNIFKDFTTGCYQITIGCNDTLFMIDQQGEKKYVNTIKMLYSCDYSIVINDAENILREYATAGTLSLISSHACSIRIEFAPDIQITEEEKDHAIVWRDGVPYLVLGTGNCYIDAAHFDEGWLPPQ